MASTLFSHLPSVTTLSGAGAGASGAHNAIGAGMYEGALGVEDKQRLAKLRSILCRDVKWPPMGSPEFMFNYYLECNGEVYNSSVDFGASGTFPDGAGAY